MNVIAKLVNVDHKNFTASFAFDKYLYIKLLESLPLGEELDLIIKTISESRTSRQNRYFWALVTDIANNMGYSGEEGKMKLYCQLLKTSGAKTEIKAIPEEYLELIRSSKELRTIDILSNEVLEDGKKIYYCELYYGSSKFNTKEMNKLIDTTLEWASECGIMTEYWERLLK